MGGGCIRLRGDAQVDGERGNDVKTASGNSGK
jgi:hypothetical protein